MRDIADNEKQLPQPPEEGNSQNKLATTMKISDKRLGGLRTPKLLQAFTYPLKQ